VIRESSISRKLVWLNVLVSAAALIITAISLIIYDQSSYRNTLHENLAAQADVVGKNSVSALLFADPDTARNTLSALESVPNILAATLFTADGKLFASYSRAPEFVISDFTAASQLPTERPKNRRLLITRPLHSGDKVIGYLVIKADTSAVVSRLMRYILTVGIVLILSLVAAIALSTAFRRAVIGPIAELATTAKLVSRDRNYSVRVPPPPNRDELAILVDAFNEMLSTIQNREMALNRESARLSAILDNAPVGILVVDPLTQNTILANQTANHILQEPAGATGKPHATWKILRANRGAVPYEDRPLARALHGETVVSEEYIVVRHDGSETWVRASAAPVLGKHGEIAAALLVVVDIQEQKKAQEALLRSEKLAAAGRLAASISHEINNPLESVMNLLFIALSDQGLSPRIRELLSQADAELSRVTHIATQTLRFYRQSTNPTAADISLLVDSVLQLLSAKLRNTSVQVVREFRSLKPITCFEGEIRQVFTNLISNAIDAMPGTGGKLLVRTRELLGEGSSEAGVQVTIADNGGGIPAELASRIFEPFYTTKGTRGTGLGLWVTREIIEKHRGTVRVRSKVGHGTVFMVRIPLRAATERIQAAKVGSISPGD
jgi:PAS domain S-box-containing protein